MKKTWITLIIALCATMTFAQLDMQGEFSFKELGKYKKALAMDIAKQLGDAVYVNTLKGQLNERNASIALVPFLQNTLDKDSRVLSNVAMLDKKICEAKGIADRVDGLLEIRLAFPEKGFPKDVLVAYVPDGNERSWKYIEAFDSKGNSHQFDVNKAPDQQILVVGLNERKDMKAGLALLNDELRKAGIQEEVSTRAGLQVAKLNYIRLEDDMEPWLLGDAEIYTLVNGISTEAEKSNVIAMEMPYLDHDGKDYRPNQVLVIWNNYRYKAANLNVYEHDDSTNYKQIAAYLIEKIGTVVPEYGYIFEIASQIIKLMPDEWFTNDDDYVDVFYTLEMGKTYTKYRGASNNATITLVPYTINE